VGYDQARYIIAPKTKRAAPEKRQRTDTETDRSEIIQENDEDPIDEMRR
jgi:hypothetical protein